MFASLNAKVCSLVETNLTRISVLVVYCVLFSMYTFSFAGLYRPSMPTEELFKYSDGVAAEEFLDSGAVSCFTRI